LVQAFQNRRELWSSNVGGTNWKTRSRIKGRYLFLKTPRHSTLKEPKGRGEMEGRGNQKVVGGTDKKFLPNIKHPKTTLLSSLKEKTNPVGQRKTAGRPHF